MVVKGSRVIGHIQPAGRRSRVVSSARGLTLTITAPKNMSDSPFVHTHAPPPRQPKRGEVVWTLRKEHEVRHAEIRDNGAAGVEFQLFAGEEFLYGQRFLSRAAALLKADEERTWREREGWAEDTTD